MSAQLPKPKFKIGDQVADADGARHGRVDFVGRYDDFLHCYTYKVREPSGTRNTWNEISMVKVKGKTMSVPKNAAHLSKASQKKLQQQDNVTRAQAELAKIAKSPSPPRSDAARELELFLENDEPIYRRQKFFDINLARKIVAGKYNYALSAKLWRYLVDEASKSYSKQFGYENDRTFSTADRQQIAQALAHDFAVRVVHANMNDLASEAKAILEKPFKG